jgi:hypothetical protein
VNPTVQTCEVGGKQPCAVHWARVLRPTAYGCSALWGFVFFLLVEEGAEIHLVVNAEEPNRVLGFVMKQGLFLPLTVWKRLP